MGTIAELSCGTKCHTYCANTKYKFLHNTNPLVAEGCNIEIAPELRGVVKQNVEAKRKKMLAESCIAGQQANKKC